MIDKNIRVRDVAIKAGVSPATVSRALNHPESVREETLTLVLKTMKALGIETEGHGGDTAKKTKGKKLRSNTIIFNIPVFGNPFFSEIFKGVEASASSHGLSILAYAGFISSYTLPALLDIVESVNAVGLISLCQLDNDTLRTLNETLPLVVCCEYNEEVPSAYVGVDDRKAAKEATEYIISTGHRKIAFINSAKRHRFSRHRYEGFREALDEAGINIPNGWVVNLSNLGYDTAHAAITQILSGDNVPNAIFAVSDTYAVAALNVARNLGFRVPEDMVVVGFDDIDAAKMSNPPLTTVSLPRYQIGYTAGEMIFEKISNPEEQVRNILFNTVLVVRGSSSSSNSMKENFSTTEQTQ